MTKELLKLIKENPLNDKNWKALAKELKWEKNTRMDYPSFIDDMPTFIDDLFYDEDDWTQPTWLYHALSYIEILLTHSPQAADTYLTELIKK